MDIRDIINKQISERLDVVRKQVFGANNERLDFVMDSFHKMAPAQRTGVIALLIGGVAAFVLVAVMFYISNVNNLKRELNESYAALHELRLLKSQYVTTQKKFEKLAEQVKRKASTVKMKPFFEKLSRDVNVTVEGLNDKKVDIPEDNPLSKYLSETQVEMRLSKVSVPRMLNFLVEIEKSGHYLRVQDLQIRGRYGTKLYFDTQLKVRGYQSAR